MLAGLALVEPVSRRFPHGSQRLSGIHNQLLDAVTGTIGSWKFNYGATRQKRKDLEARTERWDGIILAGPAPNPRPFTLTGRQDHHRCSKPGVEGY
jgi:hypothetical protein